MLSFKTAIHQRSLAICLSTSLFISCVPGSELGDPQNEFHDDAVGPCAMTINSDSELMIRAIPVVEDPLRTQWTGSLANPSDGAWSFGRLMTAMAGTNDAELFVRTWLQEWGAARTINGFSVPPRPMDTRVLNPWLSASGGVRLDLLHPPFRLLAIVNRIDLRDLSRGSAGEGRFVFGVLDPQTGASLQFTVILEYNLPATTADDVAHWATDFHNLSNFPLGSPQYNAALQAITDRFAGPNIAPARPNGSSINQVRTNEIALAAPWELREFTLTPAGQLRMNTVNQTPDLNFNNALPLSRFINANSAALLAGTHVIPLTFEGAPFRGGSAITPPALFWNAPGIVDNEARFRFSINTCNGCHAGETGTAFLHVAPRNLGQEAQLSGFLIGINQPDPVNPATVRTLNDLEARKRSMTNAICEASITFTAPAANTTLRGPVMISAVAPAGAMQMNFFLDDQPIGFVPAPPFNLFWNGNFFPFGDHVLTASAQVGTRTIVSAPLAISNAPELGPDFTVTQVIAPPALLPGSFFTAQITVCNQGTDFGGASVDLVISRDAILDPFSFPPTGDMPQNGTSLFLAPQECQTVALNGFANVPPPPPGQPFTPLTNVFVGAIADGFDSLIETEEHNNSFSRMMSIGSGADFTAKIDQAPAAVMPGANFNATVTVCNQGTNGGSTPVDLVLSTDAAITLPPPGQPGGPNDDRRIGSLFLPFLNTSQCATVVVNGNAFPPGSIPTGSFFLAAFADADNGLIELREDNNASAAQRLAIGTGADFRVGTVTGPFSATPGASISATVQVCNIGNDSGSTTAALVISRDDTIALVQSPGPNDDRIVGTSGTITAAAGQCVSVGISAIADVPGPTPGLFTVGAVVDANSLLTELDETNNSGVSTRKLGVGFQPDFTVTLGSSQPIALTPGSTFQVVAQVCNRGTQQAGTNVDLVFSSDEFMHFPPDFPMGGFFVDLAPGQCSSQAITGFQPPMDRGFVAVVADAFNGMFELNEANNTSQVVPIAVGFLPDLTISSLSLPSSAVPNGPFSADVMMCNRGTSGVFVNAELRASMDATVDINDPFVGASDVVLVDAGACVFQTIQGFANTPFGGNVPIFIGASVDMFGGIQELFENNNVRVAQLLVGNAPDFVVTAASVPTILRTGASFNANVSTCNRGTASGTTNVEVVMSADPFLGVGQGQIDLSVGGTSVTLGPGQCTTQPISGVAISPNGSNIVYIGAIADAANNVVELSETNNASPARAVRLR